MTYCACFMKIKIVFVCLIFSCPFIVLQAQTDIFCNRSPIVRVPSFAHENRDQAEMRRLYQDVYLPARDFPQEWTSSAECDPGKLSEATLAARLTEINYIRQMAGLPPATLDTLFNRRAQAAAYLWYKNGIHASGPEKEWDCYSEDARIGNANSQLGYHSGIIDYMLNADIQNPEYRMWLLRDRAFTYGYGGTPETNALYNQGAIHNVDSLPQYINWPPAGYVPAEIIGAQWTSCFSQDYGDFSYTSVAVTLNGKPIKVEAFQPVHFYPGGLTFRIADWDHVKDQMINQTVQVQIKFVKVKGQMQHYSYEVRPFYATPQVVSNVNGK